MKRVTMMLMAFALMPIMALAATWYVDGTNGSDSYSGKSQSAAKKTIQAAIDASADGDTILVDSGTYSAISTGTRSRLRILSMHGLEHTIIDGGGSTRCASLGIGKEDRSNVLSGFTVTNGRGTHAGVEYGTVKNCLITTCVGGYEGGGAYYSTVIDSTISNCTATHGAGLYGGTLIRCKVLNNSSSDDGGGYTRAYAYDSLIAGNSSRNSGGSGCGAAGSEVTNYNCTIVYNTTPSGGAINGRSYAYNCIFFGNVSSRDGWLSVEDGGYCHTEFVGCYTEDPHFVDAANGDYRLAADSPCIDAGDNSYVVGDKDLDGHARIVNGTVDIGCYEYSARTAVQLWANGPYWATFNVGATLPEEQGYTFLYGDDNAYVRDGGAEGSWVKVGTKVNPSASNPAAAYWGDDWRWPSSAEWRNLFSMCEYSFVTNNGTPGWLIKGRDSYSDNIIFLPVPLPESYDTSDEYWLQDYRTDNGDVAQISSGLSTDDSRRIGPCLVHWWGFAGAGALLRAVRDTSPLIDQICSVVFDANGGEVSQSSRQVKNGAAVGELPVATREGYDFVGWFTAVVGGVQITPETVVTADVTFFAHWQEQVVEPTIYMVQFNANGGSCARSSAEVEEGSSVGTLPTATREGYDFLGWFTAVSGGAQVSASTVVTADAIWYAHWQEQVVDPIIPPVEPGDDDEPMDASIANTYDGVIVDADGLPMGYINVKSAKATGKGGAKVSKVTATIQMVGETKKVTIKANVVVAEATMTQAASDGRILDLTFSRYGIWGTFDGYEIDGARNLLLSTAKSDKGTAAKNAAESIYAALKGNYVMAYGDENGYNGLSVSIIAKGKVKVSGKLSDGTSVSTLSQLIVGEDYSCIPVIYTKKDTSLAFNIYFSNDGVEMSVFGCYDAVISPVSGLDEGLSFYLEETFYDLFGDNYSLCDEFLPGGVSVEPKGSKWIVAGGVKAGKIKLVDGEAVDTIESENPSGLKLTVTSKTGVFKGSFKVYALDDNGKLKTFSATVSGVVVDGFGYGVATIKGRGSCAVFIAD